VSSGAFWVAISYRLAACFTGIGSTCGVEIYWWSFRHFGNCNYSLRKTVGKKWQNRPKIYKNCAKIALFCTFSVFVLSNFFLRVVDWGAGHGPKCNSRQSRATIQWQSAEPMARKRSTGQKTVCMTRQSL